MQIRNSIIFRIPSPYWSRIVNEIEPHFWGHQSQFYNTSGRLLGNSDSFDLTLGAVGPTGATGPQEPQNPGAVERGRIWRMKISDENGYHVLQYENYILQIRPQSRYFTTLSLTNPTQFGRITTQANTPRNMEFGLRIRF
jgi:hypothetical protein